jgi:3-mercaptopyruvate sulfurtransferase SseA
VAYCSIGYRSAAIIEDLERAGIQNVYNLEGGLFDWANQGRPIYRGEERVEEVHPFNRLWGLLLRSDRRASD